MGIYPEKTTILKVTCTPVFTAALFQIPNTQDIGSNLKSIDRGMDKETWYMYTMEYNQSIKRMK